MATPSHRSTRKSESLADLQRWWQQQIADLWPAAFGSLTFRRSPCVRPNCPACRSGKKHPSYALCGSQRGRPFCLYVPQEFVPHLQRCLNNGRALKELLRQAAPRYLQALKREQDNGVK
jgi:hypothetical protein